MSKSILSTIGADSQQRVNYLSLFLQLVPIHKRKETQQELMMQARQRMARYSKDLRVAVQYPAAITGGGIVNADLLYTIRGPDLQKLTEYSEKIRQVIKTDSEGRGRRHFAGGGQAGDFVLTSTVARLQTWASTFKTIAVEPAHHGRWRGSVVVPGR